MAKSEPGHMRVNPSAEGLAAAARAGAEGRGLPPIHLWNPPFCGDIDIVIRRDGTWFHEGTPIGRPGLVRLFSSILRREEADYVLVTPVEKVRIRVEDVPFVAVDVTAEGEGPAQALTFETNVGDRVRAGPAHPLRVALDPATGEPAPYVLVRGALEARIDRKTFYRLADLGVHRAENGASWFGLWSGGAFFPVQPSDEVGD
jgi:hypothetical protein